eukprot:CAMPEP_0115188760 /NCGR_PEP_ID=MMETSP0270-20121206/11174_1 /TAXON_ID=71861 /ORGANISM="Scrippsiella trochoidea, Strain CCMP3099" /LENGTH=123 /DNA_ID=CAMNT_0002601947 /DNA_START=240 /DNA_END=611 /DNA_ORIENTATION=+
MGFADRHARAEGSSQHTAPAHEIRAQNVTDQQLHPQQTDDYCGDDAQTLSEVVDAIHVDALVVGRVAVLARLGHPALLGRGQQNEGDRQKRRYDRAELGDEAQHEEHDCKHQGQVHVQIGQHC